MKYHYHLIIFRPSEYVRVDQVAVGIAVNKGDNIDIRMPYQPKISALLPYTTPLHIEKTRQSLVDLASHNTNYFMDELPHMSDSILKRLVITPKVEKDRVITSRLNTCIKKAFKNKHILGKTEGDIKKHLVVPNFTISKDENLVADFAYKNGVYHVTTVADFRAESSSKISQQGKGALKAITMLEGKKRLKGKAYAIYAASSKQEEQLLPTINMLNEYANGNIYNYNSDQDMESYYLTVESHLSPQQQIN